MSCGGRAGLHETLADQRLIDIYSMTRIDHSGPHNKVQECVFIPHNADAAESDGFVMARVNRGDLPATGLVILDTNSFAGPPVAVVGLPLVLKAGIHGNWVEAARLG